FFSSRRRHTRFSRDWSSDVCSSDLGIAAYVPPKVVAAPSNGITEALQASLSGGADLIHLSFQPIVAVAGGEDAQFQVLVRMRDRSEERRVGKEGKGRSTGGGERQDG